MGTVFRIAVVPGDGVGAEVIPQGLRALEAAGEVTDRFAIETTSLPWSCKYYLEHGTMMPPDGLRILADHDAVYLGPVGYPGVPDSVSLWGLLLPIRREFDQYVNLRPVRVLEGVESPLRTRSPSTVDMVCIREDTEGEYSGIGGRFHCGAPDELAIQTSVFSRRCIDRVVRYAFERARERRGTVASATKSNALQFTGVLWDEVVAGVAEDYRDVTVTSFLRRRPGRSRPRLDLRRRLRSVRDARRGAALGAPPVGRLALPRDVPFR